MTPEEDLRWRADEFALRVSKTIGEFAGTECPFVATTVDDRATIRHSQSTGGTKHGISLKDGTETLLSLVVEYNCSWDSLKRYLSVETSVVAVYPLCVTNKEPLFRYEFDRNPIGRVPCAHLQVHAHRDSFTHLLGWAGPNSKRARNRNGRGLNRTPSVSEFHFPLGGPGSGQPWRTSWTSSRKSLDCRRGLGGAQRAMKVEPNGDERKLQPLSGTLRRRLRGC